MFYDVIFKIVHGNLSVEVLDFKFRVDLFPLFAHLLLCSDPESHLLVLHLDAHSLACVIPQSHLLVLDLYVHSLV